MRKERGLGQEDMEEFWFSYRYYQKIESGRANITLNTVEKVARALKIDVRELFTLPKRGIRLFDSRYPGQCHRNCRSVKDYKY